MEIIFDEHHVNAVKDLAKIVRDNWPVLYVKVEGLQIGYNALDIIHKCSNCTQALFEAALAVGKGIENVAALPASESNG
jgi:hypothetical protein